jgi:molecular chaperone DnaJ
MNGKGNAAARGGVPGDLFVQIDEIPHELLQRDGDNLLYEHYITITDAALGTAAEVPTIDGKAKIKIEAGTQSGKILRLKGKGLPNVNQWEGKGDLLITIQVWIPRSLTKEEKAILEKLGKAPNFQPNPTSKDRNIFSRMKDIFE